MPGNQLSLLPLEAPQPSERCLPMHIIQASYPGKKGILYNSMKRIMDARSHLQGILSTGWPSHTHPALHHGSDGYGAGHLAAAGLCNDGQLDSLPHEHLIHGTP